MSTLALLLSWFLHFDTHLAVFLASYGSLTYGVVFVIVLCETGLVVTPFLPGDSLLFAVGALAGRGLMNVWVLWMLLTLASILGDALNYTIGRKIGKAAWNSRWIRKEHLERTQLFFQRHGGKAIALSRFMPIIRTMAPFVAGISAMDFRRFFFYNVIGGICWVTLFLIGGYFFGTLPFVEKNFSVVILVIIVVSILPGVYHWVKARMKKS